MENVKQQLDELGNIIDAKLEKAYGQAVDSATGKADEMLKGEIKNLTETFNARMDEMEVARKKQFEASQPKSFKSSLIEVVKAGALDGMIKGNSNGASFELKADMTGAADYTGEVIAADRVPGIKFDPTRSTHMRSIIPVGSTSSDVVRFVKESGYSDGSAAKAEGATLAQSDFDLTATDANVQKIGAYFRISEEMLSDTPALASYVSTRASEKLLAYEDSQILQGTGVAPQLQGITVAAADFAETGGAFTDLVDSAQIFDAIVASVNQLALSEYQADAIIMHPSDFHKVLLLKDSQNNYLKDQVYAGLQPSFMGIPVIINTALTANSLLVGNFSQGTQFWLRDGLSVSFHREDGTNVRDGFVTVRVQERAALTNYLPNAFVYADSITDAIASLETP